MDPAAFLEGVIDLPCWLPRRTHGSMFMLEFGQPHLEVSEPRMSSTLAGLPEGSLRRSVNVHGDWSLLVELCDWQAQLGQVVMADSRSSHKRISDALSLLEGQVLKSVRVDPATGGAAFDFDLDAKVWTRPAPAGTYGPTPEIQWTMFRPDGMCLALRDNATFSVHKADGVDRGALEWCQLVAD